MTLRSFIRHAVPRALQAHFDGARPAAAQAVPAPAATHRYDAARVG
jgi:hypothetical protein